MKEPKLRPRFLNENAELPLGIETEDIRAAIDRVYTRYHELNEFHIENCDIRFHESFRAMNSVGDYIGHQFNDALVANVDELEHNPHHDRRPDIVHQRDLEEAKDRDYDEVIGIEQKAAHYRRFLTSHNQSTIRL